MFQGVIFSVAIFFNVPSKVLEKSTGKEIQVGGNFKERNHRSRLLIQSPLNGVKSSHFRMGVTHLGLHQNGGRPQYVTGGLFGSS